ncbi:MULTISPECIES: MAPEG family protein [Hyphobacterium]|uniref:MAPEG family protein n=1 Tax=Hyphobacterium vulgare TaxID=1736751 RepID=A0ABV6ZT59_9PROT
MALELSYLVSAVILYMVMIAFQAVLSNGQNRLADMAGARDTITDKGVMLGRARRANANMVEAMLMFVPLVLVAAITGSFNGMTEIGAGLFLAARIIYAPLYWFGVPWLRTLAWAAGLAGIILILLQVLPFSGAA